MIYKDYKTMPPQPPIGGAGGPICLRTLGSRASYLRILFCLLPALRKGASFHTYVPGPPKPLGGPDLDATRSMEIDSSPMVII